MIVDFLILLWLLAFTVPIYWLVSRPGFRLGILAFISALLLWTLSPIILITVAFYGLILAGFAFAQKKGVKPDVLRIASWGAFIPLAIFEQTPVELFVQGLLGQSALNSQILVGFSFLGISYTAIRSFMLIRERINSRGSTAIQSASSLLFFGSFVAGPIAGGMPWQNQTTTLTGRELILAMARIFWGAAMFLSIKPMVAGLDLESLTGLSEDSRTLAWLEMYQNFLVLYIDFSGYSDIAIGTAMLYGVKLPENFNWPLRATSMQEFWQRWHMSLGAFIGMYLFKPFVRSVGKPSRAIFLAFAAVGLWHSVTLPYFVWGIGHGSALAINMILRRKYGVAIQSAPRYVRWGNSGLGWIFTMSYVSLLSGFANSADIWEAMAFLSRLF